MDDFSSTTLNESRNEWASRLINILTPLIIDGYRSIFDEALKLCNQNNESDKYLMTFQNFISRIPKWNQTIIETERTRICEKSGCTYLEDLITCVHIIQLKLLTAMRVGQKQKKIDINIPKLDDFIHKCYINAARKIYKNIYLFEKNIAPLQIQKHNRELELIVQECILNTIRENIPIESILKAYMDETVEEDITEEIKEQYIEKPMNINDEDKSSKDPVKNNTHHITTINENANRTGNERIDESGENIDNKIKFNDIDYIRDENNNDENVNVPKNIEYLEEMNELRNKKNESVINNIKLNISDQFADINNISDINNTDINNTDINTNTSLLPDLLLDDIEILD